MRRPADMESQFGPKSRNILLSQDNMNSVNPKLATHTLHEILGTKGGGVQNFEKGFFDTLRTHRLNLKCHT